MLDLAASYPLDAWIFYGVNPAVAAPGQYLLKFVRNPVDRGEHEDIAHIVEKPRTYATISTITRPDTAGEEVIYATMFDHAGVEDCAYPGTASAATTGESLRRLARGGAGRAGSLRRARAGATPGGTTWRGKVLTLRFILAFGEMRAPTKRSEGSCANDTGVHYPKAESPA